MKEPLPGPKRPVLSLMGRSSTLTAGPISILANTLMYKIHSLLHNPTLLTVNQAPTLNMGIGASCINQTSSPLVAKLIMVDSSAIHTHRLKLPSSVAELMIEFPGHVVSRAEDLLLTRRTKGMRADEQLRPGQVYLLLKRSYRVGSRADDGLVDAVKGVMKKRIPGLGASRIKVVPDKEDTGCSGQLQVGGPRRVGSWRPALDTIVECN